ncbi:MAG: hypothetical protein AB7M05_03775 [Alphaproteobacteria bacterium]
MLKHTAALAILLLLAACATEAAYTQNVRSWVGKSQGNLIYVWGEPTRIEDSDGTRTIIYETSRTSEEFARVTAKPGAHLDGPLRCTTKFFLEQGVVTRFAFEGNDCKVK